MNVIQYNYNVINILMFYEAKIRPRRYDDTEIHNQADQITPLNLKLRTAIFRLNQYGLNYALSDK